MVKWVTTCKALRTVLRTCENFVKLATYYYSKSFTCDLFKIIAVLASDLFPRCSEILWWCLKVMYCEPVGHLCVCLGGSFSLGALLWNGGGTTSCVVADCQMSASKHGSLRWFSFSRRGPSIPCLHVYSRCQHSEGVGQGVCACVHTRVLGGEVVIGQGGTHPYWFLTVC